MIIQDGNVHRVLIRPVVVALFKIPFEYRSRQELQPFAVMGVTFDRRSGSDFARQARCSYASWSSHASKYLTNLDPGKISGHSL